MKVTIGSSQIATAIVKPTQTTTIAGVGIQGPPGPAGIQNIAQASDVDATNLTNGSMLIYKGDTQKFTATTSLESQIIEGGHF